MTSPTQTPYRSNPKFEVDLAAIQQLAEKVDLNKLVHVANQLDAAELGQLLRQATAAKKAHTPPPVNSDFYGVFADLDPDLQEKVKLWRNFLNTEIVPIANEYWEKGEFPMEVLPKLGDIVREITDGAPYQFPPADPVKFATLFSLEMGRLEPSFGTFWGVQWGLCLGSIYMFGSEEQKAKWIEPLYHFEKVGSWALTEPTNGSDAAMGLQTTAERQGDTWILNGQKKWSGNAPFADVNVIWAKDTADGQVKGFLVELDNPGYHVEKLEGKISKRIVQNALITLDNCQISEADRLPGVHSFRDVGRQLAAARSMVAWEAVGVAMGAYEKALDYANNRIQFGKPITSYQMVQQQFVEMLGHITAMQAMVMQLTRVDLREGHISHERASLAKAYCSARLREVVAMARGVLGGNGILLDHDVARFFADAEAVYSYEGTYEMNTLIVGRAITGQSAFV